MKWLSVLLIELLFFLPYLLVDCGLDEIDYCVFKDDILALLDIVLLVSIWLFYLYYWFILDIGLIDSLVDLVDFIKF